jgi:hypothetical protein
VYAGLNEGGVLIIAEKVHANSARFHDMLRSIYYDFKRRSFTAEQILNKERSLRGQMILWDKARWEDALYEAGFQLEGYFWQNHLFIAWVVSKGTPRRTMCIVPREDERPWLGWVRARQASSDPSIVVVPILISAPPSPTSCGGTGRAG